MLDWYDRAFELIDTRSFSNMWFWIALAVMWSGASHWIIGVPYDLVQRARKRGGTVEDDLHDLVRVQVRRRLSLVDSAGQWMIGLAAFALTSLLILGFGYDVEFAQALFLLLGPLCAVTAMSLCTARRIHDADGVGLYKIMARHRLQVQLLGVVSIFLTALWGMFQNLSIGPI